MTPDELRALADDLLLHDRDAVVQAAEYLRAQANAQPVAWSDGLGSFIAADEKVGDDPDILAYRVPLYLHPAPAAPQAEPKRDWSVIDAAIREYLDNYELIGENDAGADACYTPTERELYLIYDAINGLLADESFVAAISAPQAEPKREPLTYEQLVSACYTYRHDFGLLDPDEQELVIEEAGRWAKAFGIGGSDAE